MEQTAKCQRCGCDLLGKWIRMRMTEPRIELPWQLASETCIDCHRLRNQAAIEYENAAAEVRLWRTLGADVVGSLNGHGRNIPAHQALASAMHRVETADARCVALKMWPAERTTRRPPWFYGDERSNTA